MRALLFVVLGFCVAGCSLFPEGEIVRLDGQPTSSYDIDRARNTCSSDSDDMCFAAIGYGSARKDRAVAAQTNLLKIAQDNKQRQQMAALEEAERQKALQRKVASAKKHKVVEKRPPNTQYR